MTITIDNCTTLEAIAAARGRLNARKGSARAKMQVQEENLTQNLWAYLSGHLSEQELNTLAVERVLLREILDEDHQPILAVLDQQAERIRQEEILEVGRREVLRGKEQWAELFNGYLAGHSGLNERQRIELLRTRSHEFPGWILERFIALAVEYLNAPKGKTLGEFCKMEPYQPGTEYTWDPRSIN